MSVGLSILIFDVKCSQLQPFFSWLSTFDSFKHPTRDLSRDDRIKKSMKRKLSSGLVWAVGAAEETNSKLQECNFLGWFFQLLRNIVWSALKSYIT